MFKIQVDKNLNADNCHEMGYRWWYDTIYDPDAPKEANVEFEEWVEKGNKIGKPASMELEKNCGVGMYIKLADVAQW